MNVYHQVLVKLYEETEGKTSKAINLMNLAKSLGLHGNYADIFEHLNREGWIAESVKADFVVITLDGAREARKSLDGSGNVSNTRQEIVRYSNLAANIAKELTVLLEAQAQNPASNFAEASKKMVELQNACAQIKANLS